MSIRSRLAIAVALVLIVTFAVFCVVLVRSTRATLISQVDQQVVANADRATMGGSSFDGSHHDDHDKKPSGATTTNGVPLGPYDNHAIALFVYSPTGDLVVNQPCGFEDDLKPPPSLPPAESQQFKLLYNKTVTTPAVDNSFSYRTLVRPEANGYVVVTAAPLDAVDQAVGHLERIFLLVGAGALLVTTLLAYLLIRRGLRPVDRMIDVAAEIAAGNLSLRVPEANPRTELGQLGGALNNMLHRIENAVQARAASEERLRRFIGDAAHELRTPLTSVRGYAELYRQGAIHDDAEIDKAMGRIEAEGSRMARLVEEMLLLARLDQQRGLEMKPVDLVALTREALADFAAVEPDRPLTDNLAPSAMVSGDPLRLRQIIDNLLTNARVHTPPRTPMRVTLAKEGSDVALTVADEGPGIADGDREHVFERFWRADRARTRSKGGSGLGLSIVASLVDAHGGSVSVASEPGKGAAFTIRLPLTSPASPPALPA